MEFKNTIFAILAIFCVVLSACAVSAADNTNPVFDGTEIDGSQTNMTDPADLFPDDATDHNAAGDVDGNETHNSMILPPDYAHNETAAMNATNATGHAAGENVTGNATNATATHTMPATGNPILALLAVGAVLGGACVLRRK